jgi:shikimate kinase
MRIYLIGFMASGKSTLGQRVAARTDVPLLDTDQVIESQAGMSVAEIFATYGEDYFRLLERDVLMQTEFYPKSLNATGGGLPAFADNMDWMLDRGITIYLQWPDDVLLDHVLASSAGRPLLAKGMTKAGVLELLERRRPVYERAAITLELEGNLEADAEKLEQACRYIW